MTEPLTRHDPHIQVLKGQPSDDELAALIAVLGNLTGAADDGAAERNQWGLPVDRLRFAISNHQRITMQQRARMRR